MADIIPDNAISDFLISKGIDVEKPKRSKDLKGRVVDGAITVSADDAVALGSKLSGSGILNVNNYTNQDLTTANASTTTLNITTDLSAAATLVAANLRAADKVSVIDAGSATINAADAQSLGNKLKDM